MDNHFRLMSIRYVMLFDPMREQDSSLSITFRIMWKITDLKDFNVSIDLPGETITIPTQEELTLRRDSYAILPFNFDLDGIQLKYATTQLITKLEVDSETYYFFSIPEGMHGEYALVSNWIADLSYSEPICFRPQRRRLSSVITKSNMIEPF